MFFNHPYYSYSAVIYVLQLIAFQQHRKNTFFILLIDADGLFPRLIRSHCLKTIVIKVSYVKEYNCKQKKDGKVQKKFFVYPFGPVQSVLLILADTYDEGCIGPVAA